MNKKPEEERIFGKKFMLSKKDTDCVIGYLLRKNVVDMDIGTIKENKINVTKKSMLWQYLYFLSFNNPDIYPFTALEDKKDFRKNAKQLLIQYILTKKLDNAEFITQSGALKKTTKHLVYNFINDIILGSTETISNPILKNQRINIHDFLDKSVSKQDKKMDVLLDHLVDSVSEPKIKIKTLKIVDPRGQKVRADAFVKSTSLKLNKKNNI
jgi:hypothetical protein